MSSCRNRNNTVNTGHVLRESCRLCVVLAMLISNFPSASREAIVASIREPIARSLTSGGGELTVNTRWVTSAGGIGSGGGGGVTLDMGSASSGISLAVFGRFFRHRRRLPY